MDAFHIQKPPSPLRSVSSETISEVLPPAFENP